MASVIMLEFEGATLDQYDQVMEKMDLGGKVPENAVFHVAGQCDGDLRVIDVWESDEAFDRFAEERIGPLTAEVGIPNPPKVTRYPVHNTLTQ
jgi:hypothetical protein